MLNTVSKILLILLAVGFLRYSAEETDVPTRRQDNSRSCMSYGHSCWGAHGKRSGMTVFNRFLNAKYDPETDNKQSSINDYRPLIPSVAWFKQQVLPSEGLRNFRIYGNKRQSYNEDVAAPFSDDDSVNGGDYVTFKNNRLLYKLLGYPLAEFNDEQYKNSDRSLQE